MKKNKIFKSLATLMLCSSFMLSNNVFAEETKTSDYQPVLAARQKDENTIEPVNVYVPSNVINSENLKVINTENYNLYLTNLRYNNEYGIIVAVQQFVKDTPSNAFTLHVKNGTPYTALNDPTVASKINWVYQEFVGNYKGGALDNSPVSTAIVTDIKQGAVVHYGVLYKLSESDKIDVSFSETSDSEVENLLNSGSLSEADSIINKFNKVEKVSDINKEAGEEFKTLEEINKVEELNKAKSEDSRSSYKKETKKSDVKKVKKYQWVFPAVAGSSVVLLGIILFFAKRYEKNK